MADRRQDLAIAAVPIALAVVTFLVVFNPAVPAAVVNPLLSVVIDATATLVAVAVAILAWVHYREGSDPAALFRSSAFLVLASVNSLFLLATVAGVDRAFGLSLADPSQLPLWAMTLGRLVAAGLLVVAGLVGLRRVVLENVSPALVLWLPALLTVGAIDVAAAFQPSLPTLLEDASLAQLMQDPALPLVAADSPLWSLLQVLIGLAFLWSAALAYQVYRRDRRGADAFLAVALILAAFGQVHLAIHPGTYATLVTSADLIRVAFYALMLAALAVESRGDLRALRQANEEIIRLREADVAHATIEERARLAREIHDGLSQALWYAKLKQGRLLAVPELPAEARRLGTEVATAITEASAEARQAITALRPPDRPSLTEQMDEYVTQFQQDSEIVVEARTDAAADRLPERVQDELVRIVGEALNNVRKHADATQVRVETETTPTGMRLSITDNGRGFSTDAPSSGYGLQGMRERAALIGATIRVESRPQDGTRVVVELPGPTDGA